MEKIIKGLKKPEKMKKVELAKWIYDNQSDIIEFFVKKGFTKKATKIIEALYNKMSYEKFPEAMMVVIKKSKKDPDSEVFLDPGWCVIINGLLEYTQRQEKNENSTFEIAQDTLDMYMEVINKLLKKRVKDVAKECNINRDIVKELLVIAPSADYIKDERSVGFVANKMTRKLYMLAQPKDSDLGITEVKQIKKFFKATFGEKLLDLIAVHVLLEKKEYIKNYNEKQLAIWNLLTDFALQTIEKQDKKHVVQLLEYYCKKRFADEKNGRDGARRYVLATLPEDDYKKIVKAASKLPTKLVKYL